MLDRPTTQQYNCVMIPDYQDDGFLPAGIHWADWPEFCHKFGTNNHRKKIISGLHNALLCLKKAGCREVYIDGSFVTDKKIPRDFDGCWDVSGVNPKLLDPVLLTFGSKRIAQKIKYFGELFPTNCCEQGTGKTWLDFFQVDKDTGKNKGIIGINLRKAKL